VRCFYPLFLTYLYVEMMNWYAVYTKSRAEETVVNLLNQAGIETLNPKLLIRKFWRGRYSELIEQLFPCYIFAFFDAESQTHLVSYTRGVRYVVGKEMPRPVPSEIIATIMERMEDGVVTPAPEAFMRGERVLIKEGPLKDFYGVFERNVTGKKRAMILLDTLHCRLEVESRSLKKAEQRKAGREKNR
jgi:transcriptional antiterminator RfaH